MHFLAPNPTWGHGHRGICPPAAAAGTFVHGIARVRTLSSRSFHHGAGFPLMSPVQRAESPAHADTNQAQQPEWNTNVECLRRAALASASSPGIFVPRKPQHSQDSIDHEPAERSRSVWKANASTFSVFTRQNRLLFQRSRTRRRNKDTKGNFCF